MARYSTSIGAMPMDFSGTTEFGLYTAETTQRHLCGRRLITWDGRVFKYAKGAAEAIGIEYPLSSSQGAAFWAGRAVARTTVIEAEQPIGSREVTVANQTFAKDELAGGYVMISGASNSDVQSRGIVGNTVCSGTTLTIYLDGPIVKIAPITREILVSYNPYSQIGFQSGQEVQFAGIAGIPAIEVDEAAKYFWLQTWGPLFVTACENLGDQTGDHQCVFNAEGSLRMISTALVETKKYQHAGFFITKGVSGLGWNEQILMLQISI